MNCQECFFAQNQEKSSNFSRQCRRFPPVYDSVTRSSQFPIVNNDYWCGEFKVTHEEAQRIREEILSSY